MVIRPYIILLVLLGTVAEASVSYSSSNYSFTTFIWNAKGSLEYTLPVVDLQFNITVFDYCNRTSYECRECRDRLLQSHNIPLSPSGSMNPPSFGVIFSLGKFRQDCITLPRSIAANDPDNIGYEVKTLYYVFVYRLQRYLGVEAFLQYSEKDMVSDGSRAEKIHHYRFGISQDSFREEGCGEERCAKVCRSTKCGKVDHYMAYSRRVDEKERDLYLNVRGHNGFELVGDGTTGFTSNENFYNTFVGLNEKNVINGRGGALVLFINGTNTDSPWAGLSSKTGALYVGSWLFCIITGVNIFLTLRLCLNMVILHIGEGKGKDYMLRIVIAALSCLANVLRLLCAIDPYGTFAYFSFAIARVVFQANLFLELISMICFLILWWDILISLKDMMQFRARIPIFVENKALVKILLAVVILSTVVLCATEYWYLTVPAYAYFQWMTTLGYVLLIGLCAVAAGMAFSVSFNLNGVLTTYYNKKKALASKRDLHDGKFDTAAKQLSFINNKAFQEVLPDEKVASLHAAVLSEQAALRRPSELDKEPLTSLIPYRPPSSNDLISKSTSIIDMIGNVQEAKKHSISTTHADLGKGLEEENSNGKSEAASGVEGKNVSASSSASSSETPKVVTTTKSFRHRGSSLDSINEKEAEEISSSKMLASSHKSMGRMVDTSQPHGPLHNPKAPFNLSMIKDSVMIDPEGSSRVESVSNIESDEMSAYSLGGQRVTGHYASSATVDNGRTGSELVANGASHTSLKGGPSSSQLVKKTSSEGLVKKTSSIGVIDNAVALLRRNSSMMFSNSFSQPRSLPRQPTFVELLEANKQSKNHNTDNRSNQNNTGSTSNSAKVAPLNVSPDSNSSPVAGKNPNPQNPNAVPVAGHVAVEVSNKRKSISEINKVTITSELEMMTSRIFAIVSNVLRVIMCSTAIVIFTSLMYILVITLFYRTPEAFVTIFLVIYLLIQTISFLHWYALSNISM